MELKAIGSKNEKKTFFRIESEEDNDIGNEEAYLKQISTMKRQQRLRRIFVIIGVIILVIAVIAFAFAINAERKKKNEEDAITKEWTSTRLPNYILPIHYDMKVNVDMAEFTYSIEENIQIQLLNSTKIIVMHMVELDVTSAVLHRSNGAREAASSIKVNETLEYIYFTFDSLPSWFKEGDRIFNITFTVSNDLASNLGGFYLSSYIENGKTEYIAVTDFEPTGARSAFVCFDEPAMKATWQITIVHDSAYIATSNMPIESTTQINGKTETRFMNSVKMSSYLVCFTVNKFEKVEGTVGSILSRVWTTPETIDQVSWALQSATTSISILQDYFSIPYPLPKLDTIAIPDYQSGAMENWGLVTFRRVYLLYSPTESSIFNYQDVAAVIAHEFGHQWFGNLVTMKWWSDLWLNEGISPNIREFTFVGFATFLETETLAVWHPEWQMWDQFLMVKQVGMDLDSQISSHPLATDENLPVEEIIQQFDAISYNKGGSIIRMLQDYMISKAGPNSFKAGLTHYLNSHAYGNAKSSDFWSALSESSGLSEISDMMSSWTLQIGYPVVNVTYNSLTHLLEISQSRFLIMDLFSDDMEGPKSVWWVPITMTTQNGRTEDVSLRKIRSISTSYNIDTDGYVILDNGFGDGFYRVHYSSDLFNKLKTQLKSNPFSIMNKIRANLVDDTFQFMEAGILQAKDVLDFIGFLLNERDYVVWETASSGLFDINDKISTRPYYGNYLKFVHSLISPIVSELNWEIGANESLIDRKLRTRIYTTAVAFGETSAIQSASQMFSQFMQNPSNYSIHPDIRYPVYSAGISNGGEAEYNFLLSRLSQTNVDGEIQTIISSLCDTKEHYLLSKTLEMSLNSSIIRSQDIPGLIAGVAGNIHGSDLAWEFFKNNVDELFGRFGGPFSASSIFEAVTSRFNTQSRYQEVKDFAKEKQLDELSRTVSQSLEKILSNINWLKLHDQSFNDFLQQWSK